MNYIGSSGKQTIAPDGGIRMISDALLGGIQIYAIARVWRFDMYYFEPQTWTNWLDFEDGENAACMAQQIFAEQELI